MDSTALMDEEPTDEELELSWRAFLARWPEWSEISHEEALVLDMEQTLARLPSTGKRR
jgi:hypothetical protein